MTGMILAAMCEHAIIAIPDGVAAGTERGTR